jgi:hypothetical protein
MPVIKPSRSRMPSRRFPFSVDTTMPVGPAGGPAEIFRGPPRTLPARILCGIVRQVTAEMLMLVGDRVQLRRDRRRSSCHVRQIAMYVSHVVLQISLTDIGQVFGRDRTTVGHACAVVEDRRDDAAFDDFVAAVERVILSVFGPAGGCDDA